MIYLHPLTRTLHGATHVAVTNHVHGHGEIIVEGELATVDAEGNPKPIRHLRPVRRALRTAEYEQLLDRVDEEVRSRGGTPVRGNHRISDVCQWLEDRQGWRE